MTDKIIFNVPFLTAGLNGSNGLIRQHFRYSNSTKAMLTVLLRSQRPQPWKTIDFPIKVTYIRYTTIFMDWDNACASFKHVGDALQDAKIISDNYPKVLAVFIPKQVKCKSGEQRIEVIIETI